MGIDASVRLREGALHLDKLNADWAGAKISADGQVPLALFSTSDLPFNLPVSQDEGVVVLQIDCAELPLHALSEATERRTGIALRAVAGKGAAIRLV